MLTEGNAAASEDRGILTEMLLSGYKVEIQAAYSFHMGGREGLRGYLDHKLSLAP